MGRAQRAILVTVAILLALAMGCGGCGPDPYGAVALDVVLPPGQRTAEGAFPYAREAVRLWCHSHRISDRIVPTSVKVEGRLDGMLAGRYSVTYEFREPTTEQSLQSSDWYRLFHVYADMGDGRLTKLEALRDDGHEWGPELRGYPGRWVSLRRALQLAEAKARRSGIHIAPTADTYAGAWGVPTERGHDVWNIDFYGVIGLHRPRPCYTALVTSGGQVEKAWLDPGPDSLPAPPPDPR